jgi:hypothetical protein
MSRPLSPTRRSAPFWRDTVKHDGRANLGLGKVEIVSDVRHGRTAFDEIGHMTRGDPRPLDHRLASEHLGPGLDVILARRLQLAERPQQTNLQFPKKDMKVLHRGLRYVIGGGLGYGIAQASAKRLPEAIADISDRAQIEHVKTSDTTITTVISGRDDPRVDLMIDDTLADTGYEGGFLHGQMTLGKLCHGPSIKYPRSRNNLRGHAGFGNRREIPRS